MSGSAIGRGTKPTPDDLLWDKYSQSFTPDKQIDALNAKAERVVGRTALVGTVLGASGLVAVATILSVPEARVMAILASSLAGLAILIALSTQVRRPGSFRPFDLAELKKWFNRYSGWRGWFLFAATIFLVAAFAFAALAVAVALWEDRRSPTVGLSTVVVTTKQAATETTSATTTSTWTASATAIIPSYATNEIAIVELTSGSNIVGRVTQGVGADGLMSLAVEVAGLPIDEPLVLTVRSPSWTCKLDAVTTDAAVCAKRS